MGRLSRLLGMPFAAVALVGAGVLSGCESQAAPPAGSAPSAKATSPSASPSASSPSASASASVDIPAEARQKTEKGAEAFVRYFFDQVNRAWTTPEPGRIAALAHAKCEFCKTTERSAAALQAAEQRYASDPVSVLAVERLAGAPAGQAYVYVDLQQNESDIVDRSGAVMATDMKRPIPSNVALIWTGGAWQMFAVERTQ